MRISGIILLSSWTGVQPCGEYCDGEDDTWGFLTGNTNAAPVQNPFVGCSSSPCQNGCTCQPSCQDENDYVCVPPAGRPFVGKNCEWEASVQCTADRSIRVSIPVGAVAQYAQGVNNVVVQGCNNAPSYICNDSPSCAPIDTPINGFFTLDCPTNAFTTANGDWSFGQTIVFDRKSSLVSMPHPIVRVECQMQTRPAIGSITPQIRGPDTMSSTVFWQPTFQFYKTAWGTNPMILANNGNRLPNGAVGYIIGERIHVRIGAMLNGVPAQNLPTKYKMNVQSCSITAGGTTNSGAIQIIAGGAAVTGTPFPVSVDHEPGFLGGGQLPTKEGVGFSFQVFTFGAGSTLELTCNVNIYLKSRKRSTRNETEAEDQIVSQQLMIFERASDTPSDVPVIAELQDAETQIIYVDARSKPLTDEEEQEVEMEVLEAVDFLSELPTWFMGLVVGVFAFVICCGALLLRRRNQEKVIFVDSDDKMRNY